MISINEKNYISLLNLLLKGPSIRLSNIACQLANLKLSGILYKITFLLLNNVILTGTIETYKVNSLFERSTEYKSQT